MVFLMARDNTYNPEELFTNVFGVMERLWVLKIDKENDISNSIN